MTDLVALRPIDGVEVTVVMDNAIDILAAPTNIAVRPVWHHDWSERDQLRAEHGYSLAVTTHDGGTRDTLLYDAGLTRDGTIHNLDVLQIDATSIRAVVLSHGHVDHHGGLEGLYDRVKARNMPLVLHPDAWRERRVVFPTGSEIHMPPPSHQDLDREGWEIVEERGPSLLLDRTVLVTGQVERLTPFERGFPLQEAKTPNGWEPDTWIWDDQAIAVNVRERGLVILSSCSHSGAINVMNHVQRITGVDRVFAFVGGFHLTGGLFEAIIPTTVDALSLLGPDFVVPGHCTGSVAHRELATAMGGAYLPSNVGTTLRFFADEAA